MNKIYNASQIVNIHGNGNKQYTLRITVEHDSETLNLKITDDKDPQYLYSLLLNKDDFGELKAQQGLRVDFDSFPKQLAKLLSDCNVQEGRFQLVLEEANTQETSYSNRTNSFLKIIETNDFKNLCHLSLRVAPGSNEDIKKLICSQLKTAQDLLSQKNEEIAELKRQTARCNSDNTVKDKKITELEIRIAEETSLLRLEFGKQLAAERDKRDTEKAEVEAQHEQVVQALKNNIDLLTLRNTILCDAKRDLESNLKEATFVKETVTKENNRLSALNKELQATVSHYEGMNEALEHKLAEAQQRLATAESIHKQISTALSQTRRDLQDTINRENIVRKNLTQSEQRRQQALTQLDYSQKESESLKSQLAVSEKKKDKMLAIVEILEKNLEQTKAELKIKKKMVAELEEIDKKRVNELKENNERVDALVKQVEELESSIKKKDQVTSFLHRKLSDRDLNVTCHNKSAPGAVIPCLNGSTEPIRKTSGLMISSIEAKKNVLDPSYLVPAEKTSSYFPSISK